jgi:hypothetical protein
MRLFIFFCNDHIRDWIIVNGNLIYKSANPYFFLYAISINLLPVGYPFDSVLFYLTQYTNFLMWVKES